MSSLPSSRSRNTSLPPTLLKYTAHRTGHSEGKTIGHFSQLFLLWLLCQTLLSETDTGPRVTLHCKQSNSQQLTLHSPNSNHWIASSCCCQSTLEQEAAAQRADCTTAALCYTCWSSVPAALRCAHRGCSDRIRGITRFSRFIYCNTQELGVLNTSSHLDIFIQIKYKVLTLDTRD